MKNNLRKKIVVGVCTAAIMSQQAFVFAGSTPTANQLADMPMSSDEQNFANQLSGSAKDDFMKMSATDRQMAMQMVSHSCKGQNSCKGQGGCKTEQNSCRGQNSCKGQGNCKSTPSQAMKMMAKKRQGA